MSAAKNESSTEGAPSTAGLEVTRRCECHACIKEFGIEGADGWPLNLTQMILCPTCGNKRCPRASDHRNACTGSNDTGQAGSIYQ
jgi:hypothetical protein